jgi:hypothetical protein
MTLIGAPGDQTVDFDSSGVLAGAFLTVPPTGNIYSARSMDLTIPSGAFNYFTLFGAAQATNHLDGLNNEDQPWLLVGGSTSILTGQNENGNVFVAYDDFNIGADMAVVQLVRLDLGGDGAVYDLIEARQTGAHFSHLLPTSPGILITNALEPWDDQRYAFNGDYRRELQLLNPANILASLPWMRASWRRTQAVITARRPMNCASLLKARSALSCCGILSTSEAPCEGHGGVVDGGHLRREHGLHLVLRLHPFDHCKKLIWA